MIRVLVVDDELAIRSVVRQALEDEGYAVTEERDGDQAIALLRASPTAHVVLLDLYMGGHHRNPVLGVLPSDPARATAHAYILMTAESRSPLVGGASATAMGGVVSPIWT